MSPSLLETIASVIILGESGVGKTCFTDMFLTGKHFTRYDPTQPFSNHRALSVDGEIWDVYPTDLSSTTLRDPGQSNTEYFQRMLVDAHGIVLLYDVTDESSFENVTGQGFEYLERCRGEGRKFGCVVVGNKVDLLKRGSKRGVEKEIAEDWAASEGIECCEVSCFDREGVEEVVRMMIKSIKKERQGVKEAKKDQERQKKRSLGDSLKGIFRQSK